MEKKEANEVTLKIKGKIKDFYKNLESKGFKLTYTFFMDDIYYIPKDLNINKLSTREILSKALLIRYLKYSNDEKTIKMITFKIKNIDKNGNILNQRSINCDIENIESAKSLLEAIGYKKIMNIKENDCVYTKDFLNIAVKDIYNGDKLIEIEENDKFNSIDKIICQIDKYNILVYKDNYFVKKAEIELNKVLGRK